MSREYEVGRGRPPKQSQFKKGKSGNPNGRPKGSISLKTILERALQEKVTIHRDGMAVQMSAAEVMVRTNLLNAMKGDTKAIRLTVDLMKEQGVGDDKPLGGVLVVPAEPATEEELALLMLRVERQQAPYRGNNSSTPQTMRSLSGPAAAATTPGAAAVTAPPGAEDKKKI